MCLTSNIYIHKYPKLKSQTYMHIQLILPCISKFQFSPLSNNFFQFSPWLVDKRRKRKEPAIGSEGLGKFSDKHRVHHFVFALPDCRVYGFAAFGSHHHQSPSSAAVDVATRRMDYWEGRNGHSGRHCAEQRVQNSDFFNGWWTCGEHALKFPSNKPNLWISIWHVPSLPLRTTLPLLTSSILEAIFKMFTWMIILTKWSCGWIFLENISKQKIFKKKNSHL